MLRQFRSLVNAQRFNYNGLSKFCVLASARDEPKVNKSKSSMVAKAFESLSEVDSDKLPNFDEVINNAKTVNGLLNLSSQKGLERKHALKVRN